MRWIFIQKSFLDSQYEDNELIWSILVRHVLNDNQSRAWNKVCGVKSPSVLYFDKEQVILIDNSNQSYICLTPNVDRNLPINLI